MSKPPFTIVRNPDGTDLEPPPTLGEAGLRTSAALRERVR
jgi:hypothetical protein